MNDESKVFVWKMFFVTAIIGIVALALVIVAVPKDYSFTIKMDDNTLKAITSLNQSQVVETAIRTNNELEEVNQYSNPIRDLISYKTHCEPLNAKATIYAYNKSSNSYYVFKEDFVYVWDC